MTPARLRTIRERMHLPIKALARVLGVSATQLTRWETGERPVPPEFADWLESLGRWQEANPVPANTHTLDSLHKAAISNALKRLYGTYSS